MKYIERLYRLYLKKIHPLEYARYLGVQIGNDCRLLNCDYGTEPYLVRIGDHVSATEVRFETHDGSIWIKREIYPDIDIVRPIVVGDNVFIGYGALILPGVSIGSNSIVGARSVVTKDVPEGVVIAGVPARYISTVEEYIAKSLVKGDSTKNLNETEKRLYYTEKYREKL